MTNSSTPLNHQSWSGVRGSERDRLSVPSDKTKADIGQSDESTNTAAPELSEGVLLGNRYLVLRRLGRGGFSDVYLAHDHELDRAVAVKRLLLTNVDVRLIKSEAKTLASLDHPSIVRIYDICNDPQHGYLMIMQYVPGPMLRELLRSPLAIKRAVEIAIRICGGLIHAHSRGVVHRDIKPTNILMSGDGEPLIADFGLAFTPKAVCDPEGGTPRYMSPEQIRNETKRIGPSSDIFSTGILLYEMLAGRVPFNGETEAAISQATLEKTPVPIHTLNPDVPLDLDRIVRRALRKNVKDRYNSMEALQAQLIQWLAEQEAASELLTLRTNDSERGAGFESTWATTTYRTLAQFTHRGLQPFESDDAKLFLSLVPGAKASSGLPETVQFWKDWLESFDSTEYARVGVLYGPSGSGKTSLLRAGIVPNLAPAVWPIQLECRKGQTLEQFADSLASQCDLRPDDLSALVVRLRDDADARGQHRKVVLLFDHFDSWLGSATTAQWENLAAALRYCDGETLQALIVVRDEAWIAATEFMRMLECGIEQWKNARAIELLDRHHARRLLEMAGRGYGSLPPHPELLAEPQTEFLSQAIDEMADRGRVLPIQLAMFVKMAKLQRWHPTALNHSGGVHGAYVGYFQDLFESKVAPPNYQRVCGGVVEVLRHLLPSADQTAHSHLVSFSQLESALKSKNQQAQLHRVLNILVEDLRWVVRVSQPSSVSSAPSEYATQCNDQFHLVHDFLTEPIAIWVEQVQKSSCRGRAQARLEELSAVWGRKQQKRYLPTSLEFLAMQLAVPFSKRNLLQQRFLKRAGQKYAMRTLFAFAIFASFGGALTFTLQRTAETHRMQVKQKVELSLHGTPGEFLMLSEELKNEPVIATEVLGPWLDSKDEKLRTRARLLNATIKESDFESLITDLSCIAPELCEQVIAAAQRCAGSKQLIERVFYIPTSSATEKTRAAILLAHLGDNRPLAELFDDSVSPVNTSIYMSMALDWGADPQLWADLALSNLSDGVTYHALCMLGSFSKQDVRDLPWEKLAELRTSADSGVSSTAGWLLEQNMVKREWVAYAPKATRSFSRTNLQQVKIAPGTLTLERPWFKCRNFEFTKLPISVVDVNQAFWISVAPVTNAEFKVFLDEFQETEPAAGRKLLIHGSQREKTLEFHPQRACTGLNAILVLEYCNWLSRKEGLEPPYVIEAGGSQQSLPGVHVTASANGFRLPTLSQVVLAASLGSVANHDPNVAVSIFCKSRSIPKPPADQNCFQVNRLAKDLMPNRRGFQFDMGANMRWCSENDSVMHINWGHDTPLVFEAIDERPNDIAALWIVGGGTESTPIVRVSTETVE